MNLNTILDLSALRGLVVEDRRTGRISDEAFDAIHPIADAALNAACARQAVDVAAVQAEVHEALAAVRIF